MKVTNKELKQRQKISLALKGKSKGPMNHTIKQKISKSKKGCDLGNVEIKGQEENKIFGKINKVYRTCKRCGKTYQYLPVINEIERD